MSSGNGGRTVSTASSRIDPRDLRVERPEVALQRAARQFRDLAGELDTRRPSADDRERQQGVAPLELGLELRQLERTEDPSTKLERIVDRLHPRREYRELVVAEVRLRRARSNDEAVELDMRLPAGDLEDHPTTGEIDVHDLTQQHLGVPLVPQDIAVGGAMSPSESTPVATW